MARRLFGLGYALFGAALPAITAGCGPSEQQPIDSAEASEIGSLDEALQTPTGYTNEPAIAINPINPLMIAVANQYGVRVSRDYGATFTVEATLPQGTLNSAGDISVTFDSQGRLFACHLGRSPTTGGLDLIVNELNPNTGNSTMAPTVLSTTNVTQQLGLGQQNADKGWIVADQNPSSTFRDRLYVGWGGAIAFPATDLQIAAFSSDRGLNWTFSQATGAPMNRVSLNSEGNSWDTHLAVAPIGDVYIAYSSMTGSITSANGVVDSDGKTGKIVVIRSTNGGANFTQRTTAIVAGLADVSGNNQRGGLRLIPRNSSGTGGNRQPWISVDPNNSQNVFVFASDDVNCNSSSMNCASTAQDVNVFLVRSTNSGVSFSSPTRIDQGPTGSQAFFPTAAIDRRRQCLAVMWYDNRNTTQVGTNGFDYKLELYARASSDNGLTFGSEIKITDTPFDPSVSTGNNGETPPTYRIGEYNGIALTNGVAHMDWTGNDTGGSGQRIQYDTQRLCNDPQLPPPNGRVVAAQQSSAITDVFAVGLDGALYRRWISGGVWQGPSAITATNFIPPGAPLATVKQSATQLDVFFVGNDGKVYYAFETNDGPWQLAPALSAANFATPGAHLATGLQAGVQTDLFVVDTAGTLQGFGQQSIFPWSGNIPLAAGFAPSGAGLAVGNQGTNQIDVFGVGADGSVRVTAATGLGVFSLPIVLAGAGSASPGAPLATGRQGTNQLDLFYTDINGTIVARWVVGTGLWLGPLALTTSGFGPVQSELSTSPRGTNELDLFAVNNAGAANVFSVVGLGLWSGPTALTPDGVCVAGASASAAPQSPTQLDLFLGANNGIFEATNAGTWSSAVPILP